MNCPIGGFHVMQVSLYYHASKNRYFRARYMLPRNNAVVTHCEKTVFYFQNKAVYRAEDRPTDVRLKMAFT